MGLDLSPLIHLTRSGFEGGPDYLGMRKDFAEQDRPAASLS